MKSNLTRYAVLTALAVVLAFAPAQGFAQEKKEAPPAQKADAPADGKKKGRGLPANGKIAAVDKEAKTIKVGERVFQINDQTRIRKVVAADKMEDAKLADAKVGDEVGIYYREVEGKLTALSVRLGALPEGEGKGKKKRADATAE